MHTLEIFTGRLTQLLKWLGAGALVGMMVLTCADVIMRGLERPIWGAVEVVAYLATLVLACSLPRTQRDHGHIGVDLMLRRLRPRIQGWVDAITGIISLVLFLVVGWQCWLYAMELQATGEVSMTLELPVHYLVYVVAVAFWALCLVLLVEIGACLRRARQS